MIKALVISTFTLGLSAQVIGYQIPDKGLRHDIDSFYNEKFDYSKFPGRITDVNKSRTIFKVKSENLNIRFFKAGDLVKFKIPKAKVLTKNKCEGYIRGVEQSYFVIYVSNLLKCYESNKILRIGTQVNFESEVLSRRVLEASQYRKTLVARKSDFMKQLNNINNYLWSFEEHKAVKAAEFDKKILELKKLKEQALDQLILSKSDKIRLQKELIGRLDQIDSDLEFYRPTNHELLSDRWNMDYDASPPVSRRPMKMKYDSEDTKRSRWHSSKRDFK